MKNHTIDEKYNAVMELLLGGSPTEICRRYSVSSSQLYRWKDKFIEGGKHGLSQGVRNEYEHEMAQMKSIIGDLTIANELLKKNLQRRIK